MRRLLAYGLADSNGLTPGGSAPESNIQSRVTLDDGSSVVLYSSGYDYNTQRYSLEIGRITAAGKVDANYGGQELSSGYNLIAAGSTVFLTDYVSVGGQAKPALRRLTSSGAIDSAFLAAFDGATQVGAIQKLSNGKYRVATSATLASTQPSAGGPLSLGTIYTLNADGSLDSASSPVSLQLPVAENDPDFTRPTQKYASYFRFLDNGDLVGVGGVAYYNGFNALALAGTAVQVSRWNADGTLDDSFSGNGTLELNVLPDFEEVFGQGGYSNSRNTPGSNERLVDARIAADGSVTVIASGTLSPLGAQTQTAVVRTSASGNVDASFGVVPTDSTVRQVRLTTQLGSTPSPYGYVNWGFVAPLADGKLLLNGYDYAGNTYLAQYSRTGTLVRTPGLIDVNDRVITDGASFSATDSFFAPQPDGSVRYVLLGATYVPGEYRYTDGRIYSTLIADVPNPQFYPADALALDTAVVPGESIDISWSAAPGQGSQKLIRESSAGDKVEFALASSATSYRDFAVDMNTTGLSYNYRLVSSNGSLTRTGPTTTVTPVDTSANPRETIKPFGLRVAKNAPGSITIAWTPLPGAPIVTLYRREVGRGWSGVVTLPAGASGYVDTAAQAGKTYEYAIRASFAPSSGVPEGISPPFYPYSYFRFLSEFSDRLRVMSTATPFAAETPVDVQPSSLGGGRVRIDWAIDSGSPTEFVVERRYVGETAFTAIRTVGGSQRSVVLDAMPTGSSYEFRVVGVTGSTRAASEAVRLDHAETLRPFRPDAIPTPGTKIEAENFDAGPLGVSFLDQEPRNAGNSAYRASAGPDVVDDMESPGDHGISYTRQGEWLNYTIRVSTAGRYVFQARAANESYQGLPAKLRVTFDGDHATDLSIAPTGSFSQFETFATDGIELPAGTYTMKVEFAAEAFYSAGIYNWFRLVPESQYSPPGAIRDLNVESTPGQHALFWTPPSGADRVVVQYRLNYGPNSYTPWTSIADLPANARTYTKRISNYDYDGEQAQFEYRVLAQSDAGTTASNVELSPPATVTPDSRPPEPVADVIGTFVPATATTPAGVRLQWNGGDRADYFYIYRSDQPYAVAFLYSGATSALDTYVVEPGQTYTYTIEGYSYRTGSSTRSEPVTIAASGSTATLPVAPVNLTSSWDGSTVKLYWTDKSNNESSFVLQRRYRGETSFADLATMPAGTQSYADATAIRNVVYEYRIVATNAAGRSNGPISQVTTQAGAATGGLSGKLWYDGNYNSQLDVGADGFYYGSVSRVVYIDANNNGQLDSGETRKTLSLFTSTNFSFGNLAPGTYAVRLEPLAGWYQSLPFNDAAQRVTIRAGATSVDVNFGTMLVPGFAFTTVAAGVTTGTAVIGNLAVKRARIFADIDGDGIRDADEPTAVTNGKGKFSFPVELQRGRQVKLLAYSASEGGAKVRLQDFGDGTARVYVDRNKSKRYDAGDRAVRSASIFYDADADGLLDAGERIFTTTRSGRITFADLPIDFDRNRLRAVV